jgi:hypothetical protein
MMMIFTIPSFFSILSRTARSSYPNVAVNVRPPLFPSSEVAFKALLSARICAAIWSSISDCDETYNYWEELHYLLYNKGEKEMLLINEKNTADFFIFFKASKHGNTVLNLHSDRTRIFSCMAFRRIFTKKSSIPIPCSYSTS